MTKIKKLLAKSYTLILGASGLGITFASFLNPEVISSTMGIITGLCATSSSLADIIKTPSMDRFAGGMKKVKKIAYKLLIDLPANNTNNAKE